MKIQMKYKIQNTKYPPAAPKRSFGGRGKLPRIFASKNSFTLIEVLIVTAILAAMTGFAFFEIASFKNRQNFNLDAENVVDALQNAQAKAIQQEGGNAWGIYFNNTVSADTYSVFSGTSYSASSVVTAEQLSYATAYNNPISGSSSSVVFAKRTGIPVSGNASVITLDQSGGNGIYTISVSSAGRISKNSETGLVGYWPMDEGSGGTAYDASGYSNNGTITIGASGSQTTVAQAWTNGNPGRVGTSLNFDGTDDYVNANSSNSLNLTSALTFVAWIYPTSYPAEGIIFNKESTYEWATMASGDIKWAINNTVPGWTWIDTGLTAPLNQWTHFAITYNGSSVVTYKNGGAQTYTYSASGNLVPNGNPLKIAARGGPANFFSGKIDDVRIYNRALSATEVQNLYNSY